METSVRQARRTDAGFLAWAVLEAGRAHLKRGWYDIAIDLPEPEALELLQRLVLTRTPSWWRFDNFLVAEVGGDPAGALCAFDARTGWSGSEAALAEATAPLGWDAEALAAFWRRGAYVFSCVMESLGDVWVIENVAVVPEFRGQGVAGRLLAAALEKGRRRGFKTAQLSFLIGNAPAERAYIKAGFHLDRESRHPEFEAATGEPGLKRFIRRP